MQPKPNQIAMNVGHLPRYVDLVVVEIAKVLCFVLVVVEDLSQRFIAVLVGVDIGMAAVPNESGFLFEAI